MCCIEVVLCPPSGSGRLRPRYDEEADLLEVGSAAPREWPYGVDIAGTVIFDLDRAGVLANFDVLVPRRLWRVNSSLNTPKASRKADLQFTRETLIKKSFTMPVEMITNPARSEVMVTFGREIYTAEVIEISGRCLAFVVGRMLLGFFIIL